jgi:hypothetical protein
VVRNESVPLPTTFGEPDGTEHIVKLRDTPLQHAVRTAEIDPAHATVWEGAVSLEETPVVACGLHSQVALIAAGVKAAFPNARVVYVMTDAAALPLPFSLLVRDLKTAGLLDATITAGQAFGGDYECVTVASALLAAHWITRADVIIVGQGPGNAGTGTRFGFSGIEQGTLMDLATRLGGTTIGTLRLSLADPRDRHHGLSHHSVTALSVIAHTPALVAFPVDGAGGPPPGVASADYLKLWEEVMNSTIATRHTVEIADGGPGLALLAKRGVTVTSMGRRTTEDPIFFHAAAAAGTAAAARITRQANTPAQE